MGLPGDTADQAVLGTVTEFLGDRIREGWEGFDWPEMVSVEERVFRPRWSVLVPAEIVAGDLVFHAGVYWLALVDAPAGEPAEGNSDWSETSDFARFVELDQPGLTPISEVVSVWESDPRRSKGAKPVLDWVLGRNGVEFPDEGTPNVVWVEFSLRVPVFTAAAWDAAVAYVAGDVVFHASECWVAASASTGSAPAAGNVVWVVQPVPHVLSRFAKRAAFADSLAEDGQQGKADRELREAYRALEDEWFKVVSRQGQGGRWQVKRGN